MTADTAACGRTMKQLLIAMSITFLLATPQSFAKSAEDKGYEIARLCDKAGKGFKGEDSDMKMEIVTSGGDRVTHNMSMKKKEVPGDGDRTLLVVNSPPDVKGTKLLTVTHKKSDDQQWLYLPAMKRVKRISAQLKSGSFMGSDFAYEDLSGTDVDKYSYKFIKNDTIDGRPTWVVQRKSKGSDSGYGREVIWYDHEYKSAVKAEFYDRKNELLKVAQFQAYNKHSKWWRPNKVKMSNVQNKNHSILTWSNHKLGLSLSDNIFKDQNLKD